ncbi:MAG: hypothetical protein OCC45_10465 [Desulfotalea sp.]
MSMIWNLVTGLFSSKMNIAITVGVALFVLGLGLAGKCLWSDYQTAKADNIRYELEAEKNQTEIKRLAVLNNTKDKKLQLQEEQHTVALADQRDHYKKKIKKIEKLSSQIAIIKNIERPANEKDCPVHPSTVAAFDIVRENRNGAENGNE